MKSLRHFSQTQAHLALAPAITNHGDFTKTRIRLHIPPDYQQEPVISRLSSDYSLSVNITGAKLAATTQAGIFGSGLDVLLNSIESLPSNTSGSSSNISETSPNI